MNYRLDNLLPRLQVYRDDAWTDAEHQTFKDDEPVRYARWPEFGVFYMKGNAFKHVRIADQKLVWVCVMEPMNNEAQITQRRLHDLAMQQPAAWTWDLLCQIEQLNAQ